MYVSGKAEISLFFRLPIELHVHLTFGLGRNLKMNELKSRELNAHHNEMVAIDLLSATILSCPPTW
jgi:hypothetical protein